MELPITSTQRKHNVLKNQKDTKQVYDLFELYSMNIALFIAELYNNIVALVVFTLYKATMTLGRKG